MAKHERRIALVTGASSGIGKAAAERLAESGYKVYGTSSTAPAGVEAVGRRLDAPTASRPRATVLARP